MSLMLIGSLRCLVFLAIAVQAQPQSLKGVVDIHVHSDPDSIPRSIDAIDLATLARDRGMRCLLLKNHYEPTASLAYVARKAVPGIELFGGIALNRSVGGINIAAVERMVQTKGHYGRVVWMPTFDAENQVKVSKEQRPFVSVSRNGELLPEVKQMLAFIARNNLSFATGHSSPAEVALLIKEARRAGVSRIVVTHASLSPVSMTVAQMKAVAAPNVWIEFPYHALVPPDSVEPKAYAATIRAIGPDHAILSSDLGQAGNALHPDGLVTFFKLLRGNGFSEAEIDRMAKANPARFLGLD
jgi:hypothetical protein